MVIEKTEASFCCVCVCLWVVVVMVGGFVVRCWWHNETEYHFCSLKCSVIHNKLICCVLRLSHSVWWSCYQSALCTIYLYCRFMSHWAHFSFVQCGCAEFWFFFPLFLHISLDWETVAMVIIHPRLNSWHNDYKRLRMHLQTIFRGRDRFSTTFLP